MKKQILLLLTLGIYASIAHAQTTDTAALYKNYAAVYVDSIYGVRTADITISKQSNFWYGHYAYPKTEKGGEINIYFFNDHILLFEDVDLLDAQTSRIYYFTLAGSNPSPLKYNFCRSLQDMGAHAIGFYNSEFSIAWDVNENDPADAIIGMGKQ